ncbi:piezo-type mechanosensitive ion channel homolog isoform X4 [Coffea arabica]|uniref:Piezo-type mechanosensitive ion channel homolog isoform X4 n=1 Tax=Coffea arabica TaxID=13443 RepID=A0ABM4VWU2_COFAR
MESFLGDFVLPLLLLIGTWVILYSHYSSPTKAFLVDRILHVKDDTNDPAGLLNWSLISFINLVASLVIRFVARKRGFRFRCRNSLLWCIFLFSLIVIFSQVTFLVISAIMGSEWTVADAWWMKLIGLMKLQSWRSPLVVYLLIIQLLVAVIALTEIQWNRFGFFRLQDSCWACFSSVVEHIGSRLRVASCLLLPGIQLVVGISNPSWLSLPFFVCSCVGLVDWSLTSNFLGLFRWWKLLWLYAGFSICLLYVYQLPVGFPEIFNMIANFVGLYKLSPKSDLQEISSSLSLMAFYYVLSCVKCDLEEMDFLMSIREGSLTEQLLPSRHPFFIRELRSGVRHANVFLRRTVFRYFTINFFTYGFPVSLFALTFWSFHFASICAFGLLAYVGYILYVFPSLFRLHRLNGLLLVFILLWAVSTYVFNVAFAFMNWKLGKDMEIWEMVGLWHYPIPGFFLLAQFCLGILVALGNLVNNTVFLCTSDEEGQSSKDYYKEEVNEETKVLIVATIAWGLRKCSRAIVLVLIFLIAMKPGFIHAVYVIFFFMYLLSHEISKRTRQSLILLCEANFAILYILQLNLVSKTLEKKGSLSMGILSQLGLLESDSSWDFLEIALLACFCAIHNHGFEMLFSFSAIVQHTPSPPVGFSILRAGLNKSVLLSVYATSSTRDSHDNASHEKRIALYLGAIGKKFLSVYRSFGTYIAFLTILLTVYLMWGEYAEMFPGQRHYDLSLLLGFQVYKPNFWGIEAGLRAKVLVIAACTLQYNVFHWLERMPTFLVDVVNSEEPCPLFVSAEDVLPVVSVPNGENDASSSFNERSSRKIGVTSSSLPTFSPGLYQSSHDVSTAGVGYKDHNTRKYSFGHIWGSVKESHKWNKKRILALRRERFEIQKTTLKIYLKFWIENMFNLFGLEINMIALLLASFALLNAISLLYIVSLAACALLERHILRKLWPMFVFLFSLILVFEYFAMWKHLMPLDPHVSSDTNVHCHDCWKISNLYFAHCRSCWLGLIVDDPRMLISYFVVFLLACFKLRADHASSFSGSFTYRQMVSQRKNAFVWRDLSFETKSMWTFLDYLRLYCYCHLLDLVLALVLITGTLEYDILHLGYLAFALIFFRMRLTILKKKNSIFKYLRIYNFGVIVLSLAYQSPFVGDFSGGKCETIDYIYEVIGFYKYDYGFRITSRSALVEIVIFVLVSLQSYMFSSPEFDYVFRYLEAEQIGAIVHEQEKKAAWKTEQFLHIRESEEKKRQRNFQVEKMKSEMLNLQIQLHNMNSTSACDDSSPASEGLRKRKNATVNTNMNSGILEKQDINTHPDSGFAFDLYGSPSNVRGESPFTMEFAKQPIESPLGEITELEECTSEGSFLESDRERKGRGQASENPLVSAVQLIGDGVSQVQSIGNQAVNNIVSFLNIAPEDSDTNEHTAAEEGVFQESESQNVRYACLDRASSVQSDRSRASDTASLQIGRIFGHIWSQMRSNNDVVCYICFVLVFLWNFSLLSMVYLAALFLYALCVNTGPSYTFWVIMLIYTEIYILIQYLYQIVIQHCGFSIQSSLLQELGFPTKRIKSSFVISTLPLFLVYLFTLVQSSITAKDGEWFSPGFSKGRLLHRKEVLQVSTLSGTAKELVQLVAKMVKMVISSCSTYWKSLTQEAESPPYFVQLSMDVHLWPEGGIQPERIESGINRLLQLVHDERCKNENHCSCASRVQIQSIEKSTENPNVALAVFEVVYASHSEECNAKEQYESLTPAADVAKEILEAHNAGFTEGIGFPYHIISAIGGGKREVDLYAYIFGADLSVFFLVAIFYQSVIKNKTEFLEVYQLEDQFPKEFVFILMAIFFLIVVDRVIYLCSFATGKVIFYLFNLILFTCAVTQYAWHMDTSQQNTAGLALRAIYLTKAISLSLQAMQIQYGVPHKSTLYRQFLTSKVSRVNYLGYRLYRALPFLYELRCVLDWSCTTTALTMYDWLKLEDINASLYLVKCDAVLNRARHKQGEKQTKWTKFCNGICLFFILICVIWAPMLMYSSGNPTNIANPINDATVQLDIKTGGGRLTLYQTTLCEKISWDQLNTVIDLDPQGYLDTYNVRDIQLVCCQSDASTLWLVPHMVQRRFLWSLNEEMNIKFSWILTRDRPKGKEVVKYERTVDPMDCPKPSEVEAVFNGTSSSFRVRNIYPRYFRVTGSGDVRPFEQEANDVSADLVLNNGNLEWWSFHDINSLDVSGCGGLKGPMAIIVSEETPQGFLGETLSKFSIWGLYITFVLAVGRFIRLQCSDLRMRIPYENLPSCDRLIAICEDIYAARAEGELGVEEILYWTLVKIYRSPHMLLEYTKPD